MSESIHDIVIEVKDVYKSFKTVKAVNGVSLNIRKGEFTALLGPNGAGKTTLVEMIEGIQKPDAGKIYIMGKEWHGNEDELHRLIGISLQETRFIDKLTVVETLQLFASFYPDTVSKPERINEIISIIGLVDKKKSYTVNLSGGQRQKLALGIALLNYPKILLLDEPTTGLDPNARREIWSILLKLKAESDTSMILTTHYMEEAEQLCDQIIIIDKGKIIKEGVRNDLLNSDDVNIIEFTLDNHDRLPAEFETVSLKWDSSLGKGVLMIYDIEKELPLFLDYLKKNNLQLNNFITRRRTLDDIFTSMTGRHLDEQA